MRYPFLIRVILDEFGIQLENDLDIFFNLDDFAEEIIYTPTGGIALPIDAIVIRHEPFQENYVRGENVATLRLYVKSSDIPKPQYGDAFEIDGDTWVYQPKKNMIYEDDHVLHIALERILN